MRPEDVDRLIYEKGNTYRLHADNLRWTLLGGYGALVIASFSVFGELPYVLFWFISLAAFFILAVQNWFYNLFARFVGECESRLTAGFRLRPMDEFARAIGPEVSPFHPAFFFALLTVAIAAGWFAALAIRPVLEEQYLIVNDVVVPVSILVHLLLFLVLGRYWNALMFRRVIRPLSNLWVGTEYASSSVQGSRHAES